MELTKGMFGEQFKPQSPAFGIRCGQMRGNDFVHNGGWYNRQGEKLGWGDLSHDDLRNLRDQLDEGQLFIILGESDSFWNFVTEIGVIGSMCAVKPDINAPGPAYVAEHARFIIAHGRLILVDRWASHANRTWEHDGLKFEVLTAEEAKRMILGI
jgi:hypothetical protein